MASTNQPRHHDGVIDRYDYRPWLDARLRRHSFSPKPGEPAYGVVLLDAGWRGTETVTVPAGPEYSYEADRWARRIELSISPTGRSVRVWVDGNEVKP